MEVVASVLEDLVLLLQPLRANPARIRVNNIDFFIGGLYYSPIDPPSLHRFSSRKRRDRITDTHRSTRLHVFAGANNFLSSPLSSPSCLAATRSRFPAEGKTAS